VNAYYAKLLPNDLEGYANLIKSKIYTVIGELKAEAYVTPEPVPFTERTSGNRLTPEKGGVWGALWDCAWFRFTGKMPELPERRQTALLIDVAGEGLIVDNDGNPVRGLTCVDSLFAFEHGMPGKRVWRIALKPGDAIDFWMDAGNNDLCGQYRGGRLLACDIAAFDPAAHKLYYDYIVLYDLFKCLPPESARRCAVMYALSGAGALICDWTDANVRKAGKLLRRELDKKGGTPSLRYYASGHAHLDLAWLWPVRESVRKAARTFATAVANIEEYPGYVFGQSQPQQYVWIKEQYPALYERVKAKVAEGRLEPQGAMWVEADTNIPGGEALVRQILYGKRFYRKEFGKDIKILHLPDVFGYSAALPQILKKSGVDYMLTIKMSWSWFNVFPYHTFNWIGQDGSSVLTHLPPEGNYVSSGAPRAVRAATENFLEKGLFDKALILYGIGDGGGGPGEEHLESMARIKNLDGIEPVKQAAVIDFFNALDKDKAKAKSYKGEMYLEAHQGTYTTQAKSKYYNRLLEKLLRDAEIACTAAFCQYGAPYPQAELERIWKEVLLYQFHDILPGSSIKRVYDESIARYKILEKEVRDILDKALSGVGYDGYFNALSWDREDYVENGGAWVKLKIPALSSARFCDGETVSAFYGLKASIRILSNGRLTAVFNGAGAVVSLKDSGGFEAIDGEANVLNIYCDSGDAWNINPEYYKKPVHRAKLINVKSYIDGAYAVREQRFAYGRSVFLQTVKLKAGSDCLEFDNTVDWREKEKMFRIDGGFNVFSDKVVCDIQFGSIERTTLENTSLDFGQFEICAHKYIDLQNDGCGVALLNDCKYGYRAKGRLISLNALRSTDYPCADADRGEQRFRYAVYPHNGKNETARRAYEFNYPLHRTSKRIAPLVSVSDDAPGVVVEAVKKAEDGDGIIVRLYNNNNAPVNAFIRTQTATRAMSVNLMEDRIGALPQIDGSFPLTFKPFEIHTLLLT
jgi:alpha-mannosidase